MKLGIVGLPNVGKSTLFNALTKAGAESANYPFCTIEPNIGMVSVPDSRLDELAKIYNPQKFTPATIEFVDIAGLVKGASKGEGLGNKFLSHIREVDAIVHVVRCFDDGNVTHVDGSIDPIRDIETISLELIFADMELVEKRIVKAQKLSKSGNKEGKQELELLEKIKDVLNEGMPVKSMDLTDEDFKLIKHFNLLSSKPVLYAANVSEEDVTNNVQNEYVKKLIEFANKENSKVLVVSAKIEEEIAQLDDDEKQMFLEELNLDKSGLEKLVQSSYSLLGLISFLTAGEKEVRAWTITNGMSAPQAAGKIHTDFEKGFIRAEVIHYDDLIAYGTLAKAKEKGLVRLEGKEYIVQDGDVIVFRFNV